jgi:gamma-glutamylcysteine synthetase
MDFIDILLEVGLPIIGFFLIVFLVWSIYRDRVNDKAEKKVKQTSKKEKFVSIECSNKKMLKIVEEMENKGFTLYSDTATEDLEVMHKLIFKRKGK